MRIGWSWQNSGNAGGRSAGAMSNVDDAYPLTPSQLGILYDSLRDVDPELYFEQVRFECGAQPVRQAIKP
jgi:hypothetical protein